MADSSSLQEVLTYAVAGQGGTGECTMTRAALERASEGDAVMGAWEQGRVTLRTTSLRWVTSDARFTSDKAAQNDLNAGRWPSSTCNYSLETIRLQPASDLTADRYS